jgi:hypothetical protein
MIVNTICSKIKKFWASFKTLYPILFVRRGLQNKQLVFT